MANFTDYGMIISDAVWESRIRQYLPESAGWNCRFSHYSMEAFLSAREPYGHIQFLLLDLQLPGMSGEGGIDIFKKLLPRKSKIIVLSNSTEFKLITNTLRKGADGFLNKAKLDEKLGSQLLSIRREGILVTPDISSKLVKKLLAESTTYLENDFMTPLEWSILHRLAEGDTYEQASLHLGLSLNNFRYHIKKLFKVLDIDNSTSAVSWYLKRRTAAHVGSQEPKSLLKDAY
ncbi:MAG TPA: hypothetical protein VK168_06365 [Saprospiraceae bacterium]|nr:hypothetical protein [Saprospiraceae bacterium]